MTDSDWVRSGIGRATADRITVCGMDVADELMGKVSFPDLAFMLVLRRLPDERESRLFNAVLVALADHGLTPTVLAARLTYTGAPESLQGAIAAGLLGAGSVFLGPTEDTARFLHDIVACPNARSATVCCATWHSTPCANMWAPGVASPGSATRCTR